MDIPKHWSLAQDNHDHFLIHDKRVNKTFPVAKKVLHPATQIKIMKMQKFDDGGSVMDELPDQNSADANAPAGQGVSVASAMQDPVLNSLQQMPPQQSPMPQPAPAESAQPQADANQAQIPAYNPQGMPTTGSLSGIEKDYGKSLGREADAETEKNRQLGETQDNYNKLMEDRMATYQQSMQHYQDQYNKMMDDVASDKIDPNKYWADKSTGSKIGAAFSILLGGIGQGLSHSNSNMAMDVINNQINQNIEAQKANLGKKQSLLADNLKIQGTLTEAENATRLQYSAMLQGKLASIAAKTNSPIIQERAQQKLLELKHQDLPLMQSLAQNQAQIQMRKQLMNPNLNMSQMDPAQLVEHVVPEHNKAKVYDEIDAAQNTSRNGPNILKEFDNAAHTVNAVDFIPGMENAHQKAMHALMGPTFKDVEGTVRQAAMDNMFKNTTPQFGDSKPTIDTKRNALMGYLQSKSSAPVAKGSGLDLTRFNSTRLDTSPPPVERQDRATGRTALFNPATKQFVGWK